VREDMFVVPCISLKCSNSIWSRKELYVVGGVDSRMYSRYGVSDVIVIKVESEYPQWQYIEDSNINLTQTIGR
jgi:hypothetical protein